MNKEKSDFTQGSILKKLIPFMIPPRIGIIN